jgi:hypothetical protein
MLATRLKLSVPKTAAKTEHSRPKQGLVRYRTVLSKDWLIFTNYNGNHKQKQAKILNLSVVSL